MLVKPGDGTIGFTTPPDGDHLLELTGKFEAPKTKEGKEQKNDAYLELSYVEDPSIMIQQYVDFDKERSLRGLLDILYYSGYCKKMHAKNSKIYPPAENGWDDTLMKNPNFVKDVMINGKGCRVMAHVEHSIVKSKKEGEKDKTFANIKKVWAVETKATTSAIPTPTSENEAWG